MNSTQIVEAVLFASDAPLHASEIARADPSLDEDEVERAIQALRAEYEEADRAFELTHISEGYQLLTRSEFAPYLERFDTVPRPNRLSGPALEALAIIAYRQPIGRIEMEYIRGVSSAGVIRTLVERGLVDVVGRDEGLGRPLLYGTTSRFLEHFGFSSLEDLPRPEELPVVLRERVPILPEDPADDDEAGGEIEAGDGAVEVGASTDAVAATDAPATEEGTGGSDAVATDETVQEGDAPPPAAEAVVSDEPPPVAEGLPADESMPSSTSDEDEVAVPGLATDEPRAEPTTGSV